MQTSIKKLNEGTFKQQNAARHLTDVLRCSKPVMQHIHNMSRIN